MEDLIKMIDNSLLEIKPFMEYLEVFKDYIVVKKDIQSDMSRIDILCGEEIIVITFLNCGYAKWWDISKYHSDGTKYEQTEIQLFNEVQDGKYNRVIYFSGHSEDDTFSHIIWSGYRFLNDKLVTGRQETRVVPKKDLEKIQYDKDMNLKELVGMADDKSDQIINKRSLTRVRKLDLRLNSYL